MASPNRMTDVDRIKAVNILKAIHDGTTVYDDRTKLAARLSRDLKCEVTNGNAKSLLDNAAAIFHGFQKSRVVRSGQPAAASGKRIDELELKILELEERIEKLEFFNSAVRDAKTTPPPPMNGSRS